MKKKTQEGKWDASSNRMHMNGLGDTQFAVPIVSYAVFRRNSVNHQLGGYICGTAMEIFERVGE